MIRMEAHATKNIKMLSGRVPSLFSMFFILTIAINLLFVAYVFMEGNNKEQPIESFLNLEETEVQPRVATTAYHEYETTLGYYNDSREKWLRYDPTFKDYLGNGTYIQCSPKLDDISEILREEESFLGTIQNINDFVGRSVEYTSNANDISCLTLYNADEILEMKNGCCVSRSILFCSLARCLGIPCKVEIGLLSSKYFSANQTHSWVEFAVFYEDHYEWHFLDPSLRFGASIEPLLQYGKIRELKD